VDSSLEFMLRHGYIVLFLWVAAEQLGVPLPALPLLLGAGALAATGKMSVMYILGVGLAACLVGDVSWYLVGRLRGIRILHLLCRIALEPDSCVRQTEDLVARHGAVALLFAKFLPGLSTAAPPLAGIIRMPFARFLLINSLGALLWVGVFTGLGMLFSQSLAWLAARLVATGTWVFLILGGALGGYIAWKWAVRWRFLRQLRIARVTPEDLKEKLDKDEAVLIVDLRSAVDFAAEPFVIPGAQRIAVEDLEQRHLEIPRDRDLILYCS